MSAPEESRAVTPTTSRDRPDRGGVGQAVGADLLGDAGDLDLDDRADDFGRIVAHAEARAPQDQNETRASGECLADFRVEDVGALGDRGHRHLVQACRSQRSDACGGRPILLRAALDAVRVGDDVGVDLAQVVVDGFGHGVLREAVTYECDPSPFRGCERAVRVRGVGAFYVRWGRGNCWLACSGCGSCGGSEVGDLP